MSTSHARTASRRTLVQTAALVVGVGLGMIALGLLTTRRAASR